MRTPIIWTTPRAAALAAALLLPACSSSYVTVPPRVDLARYGTVALVPFASSDAQLASRATAQFTEALLASQWGVEVLELRDVPDAPDPRTDPEGFAQAVGKARQVPAVFVGTLDASGVRPTGGIGGPGGVSLRADVAANLQVRLLNTTTGATVWSGSGQAERTVGGATLAGGLPSVSARNPDVAYGEVINEMVNEATRDFRSTRVRQ